MEENRGRIDLLKGSLRVQRVQQRWGRCGARGVPEGERKAAVLLLRRWEARTLAVTDTRCGDHDRSVVVDLHDIEEEEEELMAVQLEEEEEEELVDRCDHHRDGRCRELEDARIARRQRVVQLPRKLPRRLQR